MSSMLSRPSDTIGSAHLRLMISQAPAVVWATDRDLRLTYVGGRTVMPGTIAADGLLGTSVYDFAGSRDPSEPAVAHHLAALEGRQVVFEYVRGGRAFDVVLEPLRDAAGAIVGTVGAALDVTDMREARFRDLTKRETLLSRATFLADATRLLASLDLEPALDAVARIAVPFLGERCAIDVIQHGTRRRVATFAADPPDRAAPLEAHPAAIAGQSVIYSIGHRSHLSVPMFCLDAVSGAITCAAPTGRHYTKADLELCEELTRRIATAMENARLYQTARDALTARDEFLSVAAHEIRGPLTSLHLAVQALLRGHLSSPACQTALELIQREDRRLCRLVDDLLDLGRIRAGQLHFNLEETDLGAIVRDVLSRHAEVAQMNSAISVRTDGRLAGQWDRARLEQVVSNLLSNAIKYGNHGPIEITVIGARESVRMSFTDHGIGIPEDMLERIFDPYRRAVESRNYGGLGLGLHIVRTIVEGLGGTVTVDSRLGEGSTFTVVLPTEPRNDATPDSGG